MHKSIFISYSRHDKEIVFPFVKRIEQELSTTCWIDYEGIESGSQFEEVIVEAIESSKVVLFMLSDNSINSKWTKREVIYAEDEGKKIVPISIDGKGLRKWLKFHFGNVDYIDINEDEQFKKLLNNLATWIGDKRNNKALDKDSQFRISADKKVITISIPGGGDLILKKDEKKDCYVGEIPIHEISSLIKDKVSEGSAGAVAGAVVTACSISVPIGLIAGTAYTVARSFMGEKLSKKLTEKKEKYFHTILSELNHQYGIHLKKRYTDPSDYTVELDTCEISERTNI